MHPDWVQARILRVDPLVIGLVLIMEEGKQPNAYVLPILHITRLMHGYIGKKAIKTRERNQSTLYYSRARNASVQCNGPKPHCLTQHQSLKHVFFRKSRPEVRIFCRSLLILSLLKWHAKQSLRSSW